MQQKSSAKSGHLKQEDRKNFRSHHVYATRSAVEFRVDVTRAGNQTVTIDAASARGNGRYNWDNRISIQVTPHELPYLAAVFNHLLLECKFDNHGGDKGFSLEYQPQYGKFLVKIYRKPNKGMHVVPIPAADAFYVNAIIMQQLGKNCDSDTVSVMLFLREFAKTAAANVKGKA